LERTRADGSLCSFVDRDMLVRHFGHGVGHLKYEKQQEIDHKMVPRGNDDHGDDDTSESEDMEEEINESESEDAEVPMSDGGPVVDSSDGNSEDIEDSECGRSCDSEDDDDGGYASL
jgi:hypothetical protein